PELPATFKVIEDVLADVATIFRGPYIHIGGDEPRLPPLFVVGAARPGARPLDRQASTRMAGVSPCRPRPGRHPVLEVRDRGERRPASRRRRDGSGGLGTRKSHCYLDVPYAESSADPGQAERQGRVGQRVYSPKTVAESFDWEPAEALGPCRAAHVAGVEAAIWTETIADFDDLCFLLLPRLAGVAHKAWSDPQVDTWTDHRDRLARHGRLWARDGLTYFRTSAVDWRYPRADPPAL